MSESTTKPSWNELQLPAVPYEAQDPTSLIPESSRYDPWYLKIADVLSAPAREMVSGFGKTIAAGAEAFNRGLSGNPLIDPDVKQNLTEAALGLGAGSFGMPVRPTGSLGIFGGVKSATADLGALAKAEAMTNASVHPQKIWEETGWWKGPGGNWRYEIPDEEASMNLGAMRQNTADPSLYGLGFGKKSTLSDILEHKALFDAYPELKDIAVSSLGLGDIMAGIKGAYGDRNMFLGMAKPDDLIETTLHEAQHAVQDVEGFPRGSSPGQFLPADFDESFKKVQDAYIPYREMAYGIKTTPQSLYDALTAADKGTADSFQKGIVDRAKEKMSQHDIEQFVQHHENYRKFRAVQDSAIDQYVRTAGEVEARNVEARRKYDPQERIAVFPPKTQGYPTGSLIVSGPTHPTFSITPVDHDPFQ